MRCLRLALVFAATVVVVVASEAQPQPSVAVTPTPLAVVLLNGIDDPLVVADLKLKDEQVKSLVARRKQLWDEAHTTAPKKFAETAAERNAETDALLKKTLTDEQYRRATQLGAQSVLQTPTFGAKGKTPDAPTFRLTSVSPTVLRRYPELVTAFKLTDEQKKQLTAPPVDKGGKMFTAAVRMTKEQSEAAEKFLGPVAKTWQTKLDPRTAERPTAPANFALLEAKDVRTDLKLIEAETKAFADLSEKWRKLNAARFTDLSPKDADTQAAELKTETEKALAALKPEQLTRLKQIAFQTAPRGFDSFGGIGGPDGLGGIGGLGGPARVTHIETSYTNATVAKELALTEKQVKEFQAARAAFEQAAGVILVTADDPEAAEKKLVALVKTRQEKAEGVLTADQSAKWKELVGAPFTGTTRSDRLAGPFGDRGPFASSPVVARKYATFGNYTSELDELAGNKSVQEDLGLKPEQIKTAAELRDEVAKITLPRLGPSTVEEYKKAYTGRSKAVGDAVAKVLDKDQAKRFREIMMQARERDRATVPSAVSYPGVAEAVKLTDEQRTKLITGTAPAEELTDGQKSAIKEMLGLPFKGTVAGSGPAAGPRPTNPFPQQSVTVRVFTSGFNPTDDLKLADDQQRKLFKAREAMQQAIQDALPTGGGVPANIGEYYAALKASWDAFDAEVAEILNDAQKKRVAQLGVQVAAASNLSTALTQADTAKALDLTKEQTEKLTALSTQANRLHALRTTHLGTQSQTIGLEMRDATDARLMAVLTDAQKKKWKELTGEPCADIQKTVPFGAGRGIPIGP